MPLRMFPGNNNSEPNRRMTFRLERFCVFNEVPRASSCALPSLLFAHYGKVFIPSYFCEAVLTGSMESA